MSDFSFFLLYLFYGLAFFTTGVAVASKITRRSKLTINRYLWLFASFAFIHAFNEWLEIFYILDLADVPPFLSQSPLPVHFLLAFFSYCFLMLFGVFTLSMVWPAWRWFFRGGTLLLLCLLVILIATSGVVGREAAIIQYTRLLIGFPAAIMAGFGLVGYAGRVSDNNARVARNFVAAGGILMIYGVLTGLVPSGTILPWSHLPIEVLRALAAMGVLYFIMLALRLFDYERQEKLEKSLELFARTEKLTSLGKLAAGIAHEINNPLTNVSLNVELLKKALPPEEPHAKRFAAIERNLERASRIARELLAFSRQDQKEEPSSPLDLNEVIRDTLLLLGPRQQGANFKLDLTPLPPVNGLYWKIEEVFLNIIINAIEASEQNKSIHIGSRVLGSDAVVTIRDEGIGIPPENLRSIFDPFFTTKEVGQGTGLGLSICFGIMERHGGKIDVSSRPGAGTTVILTFPTGAPHGA